MVSYVNIFFWMLLLGIFVLIGSTKKDVCGQFGFMSKDTTNALRGAASLLIMSQHIGGKLGTAVLTPLGGIGVAIFLICSGYGLNESYVQNRNIKSKHLKQYWLKKIWKVFLPYAGVEALFFFCSRIRKDIRGLQLPTIFWISHVSVRFTGTFRRFCCVM